MSKLLDVRFCCFRGEKEELYTKNCSYFQVHSYSNPHYCERLLLEYMQTPVY